MSASAILTMTKGVPFYDTNTQTVAPSNNSISCTLPSDELTNDLLVCINWVKNATSVNWTDGGNGYTSRYNQGALLSLSLFTKIDGGTEPGPLFNSSAIATNLFDMALRFRLAAYDAVGAAVVLAGNGTLTTTGYTSAGGLACLAIVGDNTAATVSTPSGWTQIFNTTMGGFGRGAFFTKAVPAGAVASAASTIASSTGTVAGLMFGLK